MEISEQQFRDLLERYLNNTASPDERDLLDKFFNTYQTEMFDTYLHQNDASLQKEILHSINQRIASSVRAEKHSVLSLWLRVAAVISIFVLGYFFVGKSKSEEKNEIAESKREVKNQKGQRSSIQLPDGTKVFLNGDSKISYPETFNHKSREVTVSGEAYFKVVKSQTPFIVHLDGVKTEVLGTSFNIRNISGTLVEVTLVEGSVNVSGPDGRSALLKPRQQALVPLNSSEIITREVNTLRYTCWKDNILYFEETSLKEAITLLESWYGVEIDILNPALEKCVITAKYQNEPLGNVLSSLQFLLKLEINRREDGHITITGTGCK